VSVDSETHDQEWAMFSVVGCRSRNSEVNFFFSLAVSKLDVYS